MHISDMIQRIGLLKAYEYLDEDPDRNIPKLVTWLENEDTDGSLARHLAVARTILDNPGSNWYRLGKTFLTSVDGEIRRTVFTNFVINGFLKASPSLTDHRKTYGCNVPLAIAIQLTARYRDGQAGERPADGLSFDELDGIIEQGKALGTYFYIFSGGEPLLRREELIALSNKHSDCEFLVFTDGALIDETLADELLRVRNVVPAISVCGGAKELDAQAGSGAFARLHRSMDLLRERKIPFGTFCCCTRENCGLLCTDGFFDEMISWGTLFTWFYPYLPTGRNGDPNRMVTAEQREQFYHRIRVFRGTKPLLTLNFWNDGEFFGGCIAGGRNYCYINAAGDIEPCACIHYSDSNIRSKTLLEAYRSPLFMAYHREFPFNKNPLRPCPLADNPGCLSGMVEGSGAVSTDPQGPDDVDCLTGRCSGQAENWAPRADRLWRETGKEN